MLRVLIADDSFVMRQNIKEILEENGMQVVAEAANGKQACMEYDENLPDLVTMDINMPIMDGLTALKRILAKHPQANIIMISAEGQKNRLFQAIKGGAKHFIVKPITRKKTLEVIQRVMKGK